MKKLTLLIIILIGFNSFAQDLTCADFKNGEFLVQGDELNDDSYIIIQKDGKLIEKDEDEEGDWTIMDIKYIDDCNYILTYNKISKDFEEVAENINSSGGIKFKVIEIKGNTLTYSTIWKNGSKNVEKTGKMIKLK